MFSLLLLLLLVAVAVVGQSVLTMAEERRWAASG